LYRYTEDDEKSNVSAVYKKTTRRARQFMNRPGGFNRPLPDEVNGVRSNKI
jgi:U4/U6.U5 tri-snRNP-associated protein 3